MTLDTCRDEEVAVAASGPTWTLSVAAERAGDTMWLVQWSDEDRRGWVTAPSDLSRERVGHLLRSLIRRRGRGAVMALLERPTPLVPAVGRPARAAQQRLLRTARPVRVMDLQDDRTCWVVGWSDRVSRSWCLVGVDADEQEVRELLGRFVDWYGVDLARMLMRAPVDLRSAQPRGRRPRRDEEPLDDEE